MSAGEPQTQWSAPAEMAPRRRSAPTWLRAIALCGVTAAAALTYWWWPPKSTASRSITNQTAVADFQEPVVERPGFMGPIACAPCHADRVAAFGETRHFRACLEPGPGVIPAGFSVGKPGLAPPDSSVRFELTADGPEGQQLAVLQTPAGEVRTRSPVDLVYGFQAGTDEVYFTWRDDRLSELPLCWLETMNDWGLSGFDRAGNGGFARPTGARCMECHNTWMHHLPGTVNGFRRDGMVLGVTCEACHGPGREHASFHQKHPEIKGGHAIVHPGKLSRDLQIDLCAQCHSNALKHRGRAFSYRPGEPLDAHYKTLSTRYPEEDHVANQTTYLRQSRCYQHSETLTCTTCHNPHVAPSLDNRGRGRSACLSCHQVSDCGERDLLPAEIQDNCVGCHMPKKTKIQVNFETAGELFYAPVPRWEHRIGIDRVARDEVLLAWHEAQDTVESREAAGRLKARLHDHWIHEAEQCRAAHRFLAGINANRHALKLQPTTLQREQLTELVTLHQQVQHNTTRLLHEIDDRQFQQAFETAQRILAIKPDSAVAHGRLGTLYAIQHRDDLAEQHWRMVAECDPDDSYGESMRGWQAYLQGRYEGAIEAYRRAEQIEPWFDKINYHMGLALMRLEHWPEAADRFRKVLQINPNHIDALVALSRALRKLNDLAGALSVAQRAVEQTRHRNADAFEVLAEAYAELGDLQQARRAAERLTALAPARNSEIVDQLRRQRAQRTGTNSSVP